MEDADNGLRRHLDVSKLPAHLAGKRERMEVAIALVEANLPMGWTYTTLGEGSGWTADATSPEGRVIRVRGRTLNGTLLELGRRLGVQASKKQDLSEAPADLPIRRPARRSAADHMLAREPWRFPSDADAFLAYVGQGTTDFIELRTAVHEFVAACPCIEAAPKPLVDELTRRGLWPGFYW